MPSVLFVCLGNICRSPLAEAVFADICKKRGLDIEADSAGTAGYHVGEEPDERSTAVCKKHGVPINSTCRQLAKSDFTRFDYIIGMVSLPLPMSQNMRNIEKAKPANSTAKIALFGSFGDGKVIDDPYYGGPNGFEKTYQQCVQYSEGLLKDMGYSGASDSGKL
ncbi:hypothetical protein JCM10908_002764 [Rhodotorula pacifica]|uniref:tyrosine protein phosphatase LTP1 n=1 Tax=Rhodotorula pacifica TaxID=1495444 RepID=UPI00316C09D7